MKNYLCLVAISLFCLTHVNAQTEHTGSISVDSKFRAVDNPHIIKGMVVVESGVELIIEPGAELQFIDQDDELRIFGTLTAIGTASNKILITGVNTDAQIHGEGIRFRPGSNNNILEHCEITKMGDFDSVNEAIIYNEGDDLTISNCLISDSELWGIYSINGNIDITDTEISNCFYDAIAIEFGYLNINNSEIKDCNEDGIELFSDVTDFEVHNTQITGNAGVGLKAQSILNNFRVEDCIFNNNNIDLKLHPYNAAQISSIDASTIYLKGSLFSGMEVDINDVNQIDGVDYIVEYIQVDQGAQLNIGPGTRFGFIDEYSEIQVYGSLRAVGLVSDSIQFTGLNAQSGTYGEGLRFHPGSTGNKLQYCCFEFLGDASSNIAASIWYEGDEIEFTHCMIRETESRGLYVVRSNIDVDNCIFENCENGITITETGALLASNNDFQNCGNAIVQYESGSGAVAVHGSNFESSVAFGIENLSGQMIDATGNFWGDESGPTHIDNIGGVGDAVSDSVDYSGIDSTLTENHVNIGSGGIILDGQLAQPLHVVEENSSYNLQTRITNWSNIALSSCDIYCDVNGAHVDVPWSGNLNFSEYVDEDLGNVPLNASGINRIAIALNTPNLTLEDNNNDNDSSVVEVLVNPSELHYGVSLDGNDDYIDISSVADDIGSTFTFECWIKPNSQGSILEVSDGSNEQLRISRSAGFIRVYDGGVNVHEISSDYISEGFWHHIAYSKNATTGSLYVDGQLVGSHNADYTLSASDIWTIGTELEGEVDELRIWSSVRSLEEIRTWLNNENVDSFPEMISVIHFREFFERRFYDYANYNHCEVYGGTQISSSAPIRDIDEVDATAVTCYFEVNGALINDCNLGVCAGSEVTMGANPADDSWTWSWTGPNGFESNNRAFLLSNSIDASFNGSYRVVYEDNNGFYNEASLSVNSFAGESITVELILDNNPEETTWELVDEYGNLISSGGPYLPSQAGTTVIETVCSPVSCGDFIIYDSASNGICCSNGDGFYKVLDENGDLLAYGGAFTDMETKSICPEAPSDPCTPDVYDFNNFETSWGIWNDGGANCVLYNYAPFASDGSYFVYLRGNTNTSHMTSDDIQLVGYDRITINFNFYSYLNSATSDNFKFQASTDGGDSFYTLEQWNYGSDFNNNQYYSASVEIPGPFTEDMKFRIQADVATNYIFIDELEILTCGEAAPDPCVDTQINMTDLESGWGLWNDGGVNCFRYNSSFYASNGNFFVLLRNSNATSVTYSDALDLSAYDEVSINFNYQAYAMEGGDGFHVEVSDDGGSNYTVIQSYYYGDDFTNGYYTDESLTLIAPFSNNMRFRFRNEAQNADYTLIDEIEIEGCTNGTVRSIIVDNSSDGLEDDLAFVNDLFKDEMQMNLFPNPAKNIVNVEFELQDDNDFLIEVFDATGKKVKELSLFEFSGKKKVLLQTDDLVTGLYFVHLIVEDERVTKKLVIEK